ncbi:polysaccharide pyruvyl transferase family protein [Aeromicrobium choanae]|uniref:Polysaccharide pyruvyl transferase n=1 Tax=Aeromicrobium choanae TaxID=1736691 RepID=A0A1T4Z180_9ACTN|nr:polysaccharide pyruvyl transferase family protein [Aeromicrobium choanae]SKB07321.1 Polysaccharide pyruvyl transferase [Aeromicrobium choanae]
MNSHAHPSSTAPTVALVSGFWGQNIGNAFFNMGGRWILDQVYGEGAVAFIQDQPGYRTFHDASKGNPANDIEFLKYLDVERMVLQGPVLSQHIGRLWGPTLSALTARGGRYALLGAAFFKFTDVELNAARQFLTEFPPEFIVTRDGRSHDILASWGLDAPLHNGLDSAFFAPKSYTPIRTTGLDYYTFNFDRYPEPTIEIGAPTQDAEVQFEADGATWSLRTPSMTSKLAHRSKVQAYLGHLIDRRSLPETLNGRVVVRPEHRFNPHMTYKIYQHSNAIASDEPWTYFTTYANSQLTLADRVHACVISLAYGTPAMLFTPSPRSALFDRVGCGDIRKHPVTLDPDFLEAERAAEVDWLRAHV